MFCVIDSLRGSSYVIDRRLDMNVIEARSGDLKRITEIYVETFKGAFRGHVSDEFMNELSETSEIVINVKKDIEAGDVFVVEDNGNILGFSVLKEYDSYVELKLLYIDCGTQCKGVGKLLLKHATEYTRAINLNEIVIWTLENGPGRPFYKKNGAVESGIKGKWVENTDIIELKMMV